MMRRFVGLLVLVLALLIVALAGSAEAQERFPPIVPLPDGFQPEGVVMGYGTTLYAGSLATGEIYGVDLRTGEGQVVVTPPDDRTAVGLSFDRRSGLLFVAGRDTGMAFVYDPATGQSVADYQLTDPGTFVNDVIVTRTAAYFTDSFRPVIYRLPLGPGGSLPDPSQLEEIALSGDFDFVPGAFNANGIAATPNGKWLLLVHSTRGELYRVHPQTGEATLIDLHGESVPAGDGILLQGKTLYVVQNQLNQIAVVQLDPHFTSGQVLERITNQAFSIPTTIASFGPYLYAVNARFGTPPAGTEYQVVRVPK